MAEPTLIVYSRAGCHLCETLIEELLPLVRQRARVEIVDIDSSDELAARYGELVPVIEAQGRELCRYRLDRAAVLGALRS